MLLHVFYSIFFLPKNEKRRKKACSFELNDIFNPTCSKDTTFHLQFLKDKETLCLVLWTGFCTNYHNTKD